MLTTMIGQIVRFACPNIQIYDVHVVDLCRRVCARYRVGVKGAETRAKRSWYAEGNVASQIAALNAPSPPLKGVEAVLLTMASKAAIAGAPGCMGIGAICELGKSDAEVSTLIGKSGKRLLSALEQRLAEAKGKGEIGTDVDARAAAQFVKATITGVKVAARGGAQRICCAISRAWRCAVSGKRRQIPHPQ